MSQLGEGGVGTCTLQDYLSGHVLRIGLLHFEDHMGPIVKAAVKDAFPDRDPADTDADVDDKARHAAIAARVAKKDSDETRARLIEEHELPQAQADTQKRELEKELTALKKINNTYPYAWELVGAADKDVTTFAKAKGLVTSDIDALLAIVRDKWKEIRVPKINSVDISAKKERDEWRMDSIMRELEAQTISDQDKRKLEEEHDTLNKINTFESVPDPWELVGKKKKYVLKRGGDSGLDKKERNELFKAVKEKIKEIREQKEENADLPAVRSTRTVYIATHSRNSYVHHPSLCFMFFYCDSTDICSICFYNYIHRSQFQITL